MLLKSIKIKDFRQFKGQQDPIHFSTDPEKNVTVIMGENGSGKTTLAQAFTWCLYGLTDFEDSSMLCKATAQNMLPSDVENVRIELALIHNAIEYTVIRNQKYTKDNSGKLKQQHSMLTVAYKNEDGQQEFIKETETDLRMKEILPKNLSRYFFFDGERIGNMSKEIRRGKSNEFAQAVRSLLGLSAFTSALDHLNGRSKITAMKSYNENYDPKSNAKVLEYTQKIDAYDIEIEKIETRLAEIESEEAFSTEKRNSLAAKIEENAKSQTFSQEKNRLRLKLDSLVKSKESTTKSMLSLFNSKSPAYFAQKLMQDALSDLSKTDKLDKGIPDIHARTIEFLLSRGTCLCGSEIKIGNDAYNELHKLLAYIPPQSIGGQINNFVRECELKLNSADTFYTDFVDKYSTLRDLENTHSETLVNISNIEEVLKNTPNVGQIQRDLMRYEKSLSDLRTERDALNRKNGNIETSKERCNTERQTLTLKDEHNRKIEVYKAYTQYMYDTLNSMYKEKEAEIRTELGKNINEIFKNIYNGGFSLAIDEKYNIQIVVDEYQGYSNDIETSTAQSISVIFAFIAGVIKMARQSRSPENDMLVSESYPLVMDAPLSAFDKTRIKTVCDALPKVAEQVIIFIKDTDGEIAEEHMSGKVGQRYLFDKKNEFETYLVER